MERIVISPKIITQLSKRPLLSHKNVQQLFNKCAISRLEETTDYDCCQRVDSIKTISTITRINMDSVDEYRDKITNMVNQLPRSFDSDNGSDFKNLAFNRHKKRWAKTPFVLNQLLALGIASGTLKHLTANEPYYYENPNDPTTAPHIKTIHRVRRTTQNKNI